MIRPSALLCLLCLAMPAWAAPRVVVSVPPLHSLVSGVTAGVTEPVLLLPGAASPHDYSLRPSDMRALSGSDIVVWAGPGLENFLVRPLATLSQRTVRIELMREANLELLVMRSGGDWEPHDHDHDHDHAHGHDDHEDLAHDPHVWLSPDNARRIVAHVAARLTALDPDHAAAYAANRDRVLARIDALDRKLAASLTPLAERPYIVFHDAYQYFERAYGLTPAGAVTLDPAHPPGARRVREIRARIVAERAICVFSEPQFTPALLRTLTEGTPARIGVLDPIGSGLPAGEEHWFALMSAMGEALAGCLGD